MPAVSFLKAPAYQDGHAGYSDPLDEQTSWSTRSTRSSSPSTGRPRRSSSPTTTPTAGTTTRPADRERLQHRQRTRRSAPRRRSALGSYPDRCGYGPRLPLLVISPCDQAELRQPQPDRHSPRSSRFIEDNWLGGQRIGNGSYDAISGSLDAPRRRARLPHQAALPARHPQPDHRRGRQQLAETGRPAAATGPRSQPLPCAGIACRAHAPRSLGKIRLVRTWVRSMNP